jgi:pumilio homology domain family member 6
MTKIVIDPPLDFAGRLYKAINPNWVNWAIGEGSFVIVGLLEVLSGKEEEELRSHLKSKQKVLQARGKDNKGTKIILEKIG